MFGRFSVIASVCLLIVLVPVAVIVIVSGLAYFAGIFTVPVVGTVMVNGLLGLAVWLTVDVLR